MSPSSASGPTGYSMPAEWVAHERTWISWPCRAALWGERFAAVKRNYVEVAKAVARFEPVTVIANPEDLAEAQAALGPEIEVVAMAIDDSWSRDNGPCFLLDDAGDLAGASFRFNAWGGKYRPYDQDATLAERLLQRLGAPRVASDLTAEGGGLCVDGEGTLLTTESCLLNTNRNPGWTKREVEAELKRTLGVAKVIWMPGNTAETETDGHVDGIAMFVRPGVILLETIPDPHDPQAAIVRENIRALEGQTDAKGRPIEIAFMQEAYEAVGHGDRFCRSYVNFYFVNGGLIAPAYGIEADHQARAVFERLCPDRQIVQLRIDEIATGGGGIHCMTQQQPARRAR